MAKKAPPAFIQKKIDAKDEKKETKKGAPEAKESKKPFPPKKKC